MSRWLRRSVALLPLAPVLLVLPVLVDGMHCDLRRGYWNAARAQLVRLEMSIEAFRLDCGRLPHALDELIGVLDRDSCAGPFARASQLIDPWGNPIAYERSPDGQRFDVRAVGKDGVYGSVDDVAIDGWEWPWPEPFWCSWFRADDFGQFLQRFIVTGLVLGWPMIALVGLGRRAIRGAQAR